MSKIAKAIGISKKMLKFANVPCNYTESRNNHIND